MKFGRTLSPENLAKAHPETKSFVADVLQAKYATEKIFVYEFLRWRVSYQWSKQPFAV